MRGRSGRPTPSAPVRTGPGGVVGHPCFAQGVGADESDYSELVASAKAVPSMDSSPRSTKVSEFGCERGAAIGMSVIQGWRSSMSRWITAQFRSLDRQSDPSSDQISGTLRTGVPHQLEQLVLVVDMAVEGHRGEPELLCDSGHGDGPRPSCRQHERRPRRWPRAIALVWVPADPARVGPTTGRVRAGGQVLRGPAPGLRSDPLTLLTITVYAAYSAVYGIYSSLISVSASHSATIECSTRWIWPSRPGRSSPCSARTGRARRQWCASWPLWCDPIRAPRMWPATIFVRPARGESVDQSHRPVRRG